MTSIIENALSKNDNFIALIVHCHLHHHKSLTQIYDINLFYFIAVLFLVGIFLCCCFSSVIYQSKTIYVLPTDLNDFLNFLSQMKIYFKASGIIII